MARLFRWSGGNADSILAVDIIKKNTSLYTIPYPAEKNIACQL